jgi:hypothetical protein
MLADEHPDFGHVGPQTLGGTPVGIMIYVDDVDTIYKRAISGGGQEVKPLQDQFYGDRSGTLKDPFGHMWTVATHVEDVAPEEMENGWLPRMAAVDWFSPAAAKQCGATQVGTGSVAGIGVEGSRIGDGCGSPSGGIGNGLGSGCWSGLFGS